MWDGEFFHYYKPGLILIFACESKESNLAIMRYSCAKNQTNKFNYLRRRMTDDKWRRGEFLFKTGRWTKKTRQGEVLTIDGADNGKQAP